MHDDKPKRNWRLYWRQVLSENDWAGILAVILVLGYTVLLSIALALYGVTAAIEVAAVLGYPTGHVVSYYFTKRKKQVK